MNIGSLSITKNEILGLVAGIIPFFLFIGSTSSNSVNGQVVSSSSFNLVAIVGGAIALLLAFNGLRELSDQTANSRLVHIGLAVALVLLGAFQIMRGIGMIG